MSALDGEIEDDPLLEKLRLAMKAEAEQRARDRKLLADTQKRLDRLEKHLGLSNPTG